MRNFKKFFMLVMMVTAMLMMAGCGKKTIDLNKYIREEAVGANEYGRVLLKLDMDQLKEDYGSTLEYSKAVKKELGEDLELFEAFHSPFDAIKEAFEICIIEEDGSTRHMASDMAAFDVSNGDVVKYTINPRKAEIAEELNYKFVYKPAEYHVSGLPELIPYDVFENISLSFIGVDGEGIASLNCEGNILPASRFTLNKSEGLKNGDSVTVLIDENEKKYFATEYGYKLESVSKEFKVEGLEEYVTSFEDISEESLKRLVEETKDRHDAKFVMRGGEEIVSFEYVGTYLLSKKNPLPEYDYWYGNRNKMIVIFERKIRNTESKYGQDFDATTTGYWYYTYTDLSAVDGDLGNVQNLRGEYPQNTYQVYSDIYEFWGSNWWSYGGYLSLDELYKGEVASNLDEYNFEKNFD